jgi:hypothetical protein
MKATHVVSGGPLKTLQLASTEHSLRSKMVTGAISAQGVHNDPRYKMYTPAFVTDGVMQRRNKRAQSSQRTRNMVYKTIDSRGHELNTPVSAVRDDPIMALSKLLSSISVAIFQISGS